MVVNDHTYYFIAETLSELAAGGSTIRSNGDGAASGRKTGVTHA